jgi:diadenosine tetraphosphatase ApaH/serine/threonine PP2A family protein phosphatase
MRACTHTYSLSFSPSGSLFLSLSTSLGFKRHVETRCPTTGQLVYEAIHSAFEWLPLGAVVGRSVLVLHGGIGDGSWSVADLASVCRPIKEVHQEGVPACVYQALWSDPSDSDAEMAYGVHPNKARGDKDAPKAVLFGPDVTAKFCHRNRLQLVIRSHQFVRQGVKFMHGLHCICDANLCSSWCL